MQAAGGDSGVSALGRIGLTDAVGTPADNGLIGAQPTGVFAAHCDRGEGGHRDGGGDLEDFDGLAIEHEVAVDGVVPSPMDLGQHSCAVGRLGYRDWLLVESVVLETPVGRGFSRRRARTGEPQPCR